MPTKLERLRWYIAATINIAPSAVTSAQMERFGEGMHAVSAASWAAKSNAEKLDIAVAKARHALVTLVTDYENERNRRAAPQAAAMPEEP